MGHEEQFNLPLEPRLTQEKLNTLPELLSGKDFDVKIEEPVADDSIELSATANGVTSVFTLNLFNLTLKLNEEKSYDLFEDSGDYTDVSSRPLKSAEDIHEDRRMIIQESLKELDNPTLIETD